MRKPIPVAWITDGGKGSLWWSKSSESDMPLYTAPPQQWVGLTEQQIKILLSDSKCWVGDDCSMPDLTYIIRAVEKAHGIGK
jgi:hypothetical protein